MVERPPDIDGAVLNDVVDYFRQRSCEIRIRELRKYKGPELETANFRIISGSAKLVTSGWKNISGPRNLS